MFHYFFARFFTNYHPLHGNEEDYHSSCEKNGKMVEISSWLQACLSQLNFTLSVSFVCETTFM